MNELRFASIDRRDSGTSRLLTSMRKLWVPLEWKVTINPFNPFITYTETGFPRMGGDAT